MDIADTLKKLEEQLQTQSVRTNAAAVFSMLAEDFTEYGSSGRVFSKAEIIRELQSESPGHITMHDFAASFLTKTIALVTYRASSHAPGSRPVNWLVSMDIFRKADGKCAFIREQKCRQLPDTPRDPLTCHSDRSEAQRAEWRTLHLASRPRLLLSARAIKIKYAGHQPQLEC